MCKPLSLRPSIHPFLMTQTKTWIYQCFLDCPKMSFWSLLSLNCCHLFKIYAITSCGDTHMTSTLRGVGYKTKTRCYRSLGLGLASVLDVQSFLSKIIGFLPWPDESNIDRKSSYWLWSQNVSILQWYHCIVCGRNQTIERVVSLNVTWLGFVFVLILFVCTNDATVVP